MACTVSRDVQNFDLLIEDMEAGSRRKLGRSGICRGAGLLRPARSGSAGIHRPGDRRDGRGQSRSDGRDHHPGQGPRHQGDPDRRRRHARVAASAAAPGRRTNLSPTRCPRANWHRRSTACAPRTEAGRSRRTPMPTQLKAGAQKDGAVDRRARSGRRHRRNHAGRQPRLGTGERRQERPASVCLLDFDLQFGSVSTFLDLPRREVVYEMLSDTEDMDEEIFGQALLTYEDKLAGLTAPTDMLPLDLITSEDVNRILDMAREPFRLCRRRHALDAGAMVRNGAEHGACLFRDCSNLTCARRRTRCASSARCSPKNCRSTSCALC